MGNTVAIRREDLNKRGEKRVALSPAAVERLTKAGIPVLIQPAIHPRSKVEKRIFEDSMYVDAGAKVSDDISEANLIFGLKEISKEFIQDNKNYLLFSHTHKGQIKNREMLKRFVDGKCTVIDYELIRDEQNRRIVTAFTYFAGYAGMIDSLWTYGARLKQRGIQHPFSLITQSIESGDLEKSKEIVRMAGSHIANVGTPDSLPPMICTILGTGKTSKGAQDMYELLPVREIKLSELEDVYKNGDRDKVYELILEIDDMYRLREEAGTAKSVYEIWPSSEKMDLYFKHPEEFESNLDQILPYTSILMNCTLWSPRFPRTLPRELMISAWKSGTPLEVIGDITCDPDGSIEFSKETWIDDPVYIYDPVNDKNIDGWEGEGVAVMAVTNLPCEFSADASIGFSKDISHLLPGITKANYEGTADEAGLPDEVKRAVILWQGQFMPDFAYMEEYLP